MQAEDENAAVAMALGAAFGGAVSAVGHERPRALPNLRSDRSGRDDRIAADCDRRATVRPQHRPADQDGTSRLLQAMFGRNGESPVAVLAPSTPSDGFATTLKAVRLACRYTTPVWILSDVFLSGGAEPWRIPASEELSIHQPVHPTPFQPYSRNEFGSRPWTAPGTPDREHRIGGLEKEDGTGAVSYDPINHEKMVQLRAAKIAQIADDSPISPSLFPPTAIYWSSAGAARTVRSPPPCKPPFIAENRSPTPISAT